MKQLKVPHTTSALASTGDCPAITKRRSQAIGQLNLVREHITSINPGTLLNFNNRTGTIDHASQYIPQISISYQSIYIIICSNALNIQIKYENFLVVLWEIWITMHHLFILILKSQTITIFFYVNLCHQHGVMGVWNIINVLNIQSGWNWAIDKVCTL